MNTSKVNEDLFLELISPGETSVNTNDQLTLWFNMLLALIYKVKKIT